MYQFIFAIFLIVGMNVLYAGDVHSLIQKGDSKNAIQLIKDNPDLINSIDDSQRTPLHLASRFSGVEMVTFLIDSGADPNVKVGKFEVNLFDTVESTASPEMLAILRRACKPNRFRNMTMSVGLFLLLIGGGIAARRGYLRKKNKIKSVQE